jgi:hypothetical protein
VLQSIKPVKGRFFYEFGLAAAAGSAGGQNHWYTVVRTEGPAAALGVQHNNMPANLASMASCVFLRKCLFHAL